MDLLTIITKIETFVTEHTFFWSVFVFTIGLLIRPLIDLYFIRVKTLRQEKARRKHESYQKIHDLLFDFFSDNAKAKYRSLHRDPTEESRLLQEAQGEGKDPLCVLLDSIAPLNRPEDLMTEIGKHSRRAGDKKLECLLLQWGKAFEALNTSQREKRGKIPPDMTKEQAIAFVNKVYDAEIEREDC